GGLRRRADRPLPNVEPSQDDNQLPKCLGDETGKKDDRKQHKVTRCFLESWSEAKLPSAAGLEDLSRTNDFA
ncbi:MAG: hypothetical protein AAGA03_19030, partial [Planctomycetota bacterium]